MPNVVPKLAREVPHDSEIYNHSIASLKKFKFRDIVKEKGGLMHERS